MSQGFQSVSEIVETLQDLAESEDEVTIGDVMEALGGRSLGPMIVLPALLVLTPLGGIPGVPTLMALLIALLAVQIALGRGRLWLPGWLRERGVSDDKVTRSADKLEGVARWLDDHLGGRLEALTRAPMPRVAAGVVVLLCALVPPSEVIPFGAFVPMGAIALIGLALTLRDGLVMLLGLAGAAAALVAIGAWMM